MAGAFLGLDLADPYATRERPSTLAILRPNLICTFVEWQYSQTGEGLPPPSIESAEFTLAIDGPQGLAGEPEMKSRVCERMLRAPGKSPFEFPEASRPYAGFIRGSILLFYTLHTSERFSLFGAPGSARVEANLLEVYPGAAWPLLAGVERLANKRTVDGREQRQGIIEGLGVQFPDAVSLTHDHLDAVLCAWIGYRFNQRKTWWIGAPPVESTDEPSRLRVLREGYIVQPFVGPLS